MSTRAGSRSGRGRAAFVLLGLAAAIWFLARWLGTPAAPRERAPRTIVLVAWDSVALDALEPWGGSKKSAPRLAALARESLVFEHHVPSSNGTNAAMSSLLTGLEPRRHGVGRIDAPGGGRLADELETLAERLSERGFRGLASLALPQLAPEVAGLARGFELCAAPLLEPLEFVRAAAGTFGAVREPLAALLASRDAAFVLLHFADARAPARDRPVGAERFVIERLAPFRAELREVDAALALVEEKPDDALAQLSRDLLRKRGHPARLAYVRALYDARVEAMDAALGELIDMLEASGRWSEAVVAVCGTRARLEGASEDGDPAPGLVAPLLLRLPGGRWSGRSSAITRDVDLVPTLLAAAGAPVPEGLDGIDLTATLFRERSPAETRAAAFVEDERFERRVAVGRERALERSLAGGERVIELARDAGEASEQGDDLDALRALLDARPPLGRSSIGWIGAGAAASLVARAPGSSLAPPDHHDEAAPQARATSSQALELTEHPASLRAAGRWPDLALSLRIDGGIDETRVHVGGRALAELDLGLLADPGAPVRARSGADAPPPARVRIEKRGGGWSAVLVGLEPGAAARAVVELFPFAVDGTEGLVAPDAGASVEPHPRRPGALVVRGVSPLGFRVRSRPSGEPALAFFLDEQRVLASEIELDGRSFAGPGALELCLTAGAWCDPELYLPLPEERGPGAWIELLDAAPLGFARDAAPIPSALLRTLAAAESP